MVEGWEGERGWKGKGRGGWKGGRERERVEGWKRGEWEEGG